jgi:hypothetical protein
MNKRKFIFSSLFALAGLTIAPLLIYNNPFGLEEVSEKEATHFITWQEKNGKEEYIRVRKKYNYSSTMMNKIKTQNLLTEKFAFVKITGRNKDSSFVFCKTSYPYSKIGEILRS